ncbi:MAG: cell wall hydrolase [Parcubacteria group bacterium]|nr:cell wall hydrolase [Parcubacteria group bacterium]
MEILIEEKIGKRLKEKSFEWGFDVEKQGLYGIEVTASAETWKHNFFSPSSLWKRIKSKTIIKDLFNLRSFRSKDDNLKVKIDNKLSFDNRAKWNGNTLKGAKQTNLFITHFEQGKHTLNLTVAQQPRLETIRVFQIQGTTISYLPKHNHPPEQGNRRQWLTIVLINLGLGTLSVKASAKKGTWYSIFRRDDDDLKLIINKTIQKNYDKKCHKYWHWCGRALKGESKQFQETLNLPPDTHYIEFWADRSPLIENIELEIIDNKEQMLEEIRPTEEYKRIPTVDDPRWTGDFRDDTEQMILARAIWGEAEGEPREGKLWVVGVVMNRVKTPYAWPNTIHDVILQDKQFDPFKLTDPRYAKIINPLGFEDSNELIKMSWYECYEIAQDMISGEIENPTTATHFHGKGVDREWFERNVVPKGIFLKKIGKTYFYWSPN